ncbi:MAG: HlyD family efflux transporter periplasmic adaptor subunit [Pseudomonadota bacterium]|nr:HlyD family efflux transporter periplasmic adaptor subunit [Pseudomonadota bacterium]
MRLFLIILLAGGLAACSGSGDSGLHGYAEGDFSAIAPDTPGRIVRTYAAEGETVSAGDPLFTLEATAERAAVAAAEARIDAAIARFDDAAAGGRTPEIAAARDQLEQAQTAAREAADTLSRTRSLFEDGHVSEARLDRAEAAADTARARVSEMRQRLSLVQLPARENQLRALQAEIASAEAERERAADALARRAIAAPADAVVHRQIRFTGEQAGPAQPVYDLLPEGAIHALLFIPEAELGGYTVGDRLAVDCDSCPPGLTARIASIADEAEFTPPVIYSDNERARLVYRAEARFDGPPPPPGTPLRFGSQP